MNGKRIFGVFILVAAIFVIGSCAKPPTDDIDAANSALARAEADADVVEYAPASLSRVKSLIDRMKAEVDAKRYDSAKSLAQEAVKAADEAIKDGADAKAKARTDAASVISSAKAGLVEVRQSLEAAKKVRGISLDIPATERDVNASAQTVSTAEADFAKSAFATAQMNAQSARSAIADIQRRIAGAVQAATRRK